MDLSIFDTARDNPLLFGGLLLRSVLDRAESEPLAECALRASLARLDERSVDPPSFFLATGGIPRAWTPRRAQRRLSLSVKKNFSFDVSLS